MNILERFWGWRSRQRIAELENKLKLADAAVSFNVGKVSQLEKELAETKQEHTAEIADLVRRHRASMQKQADDYCAGLDELSKSLSQLQGKEACDGGSQV